jgi:coenzyme F420-reducing hydrogenase beta subunit
MICDARKCTGCALCSDVCPVNAIAISDKNGFYRPVVDDSKCIKCGICKKTCPSEKATNIASLNLEHDCLASYSLDTLTHFECASGGLCTEISKGFIANGGVVCGAWFNPDTQRVEHRLVHTIDGLEYLKKSKYVQSYLHGVYHEIKQIIKTKKVLFIGVPCQVNAIESFIDERHKGNLYSIDLLCHGGSSPLCLTEHIKNMSKGKKVNNVSFRGGAYDCNFVLYDKDGRIIYRGPQFTDPYFASFMKHSIFNEVCFNCKFAGNERLGNITVGDFWGLEESLIPTVGGYGVNMVIVNNDKGNYLLDIVKRKMKFVKRPIREAVAGNETLYQPTDKPKEYDELWSVIVECGFAKGLDVYGEDFYNKSIFECKKWLRKQKIKSAIKAVLPKQIIETVKGVSS